MRFLHVMCDFPRAVIWRATQNGPIKEKKIYLKKYQILIRSKLFKEHINLGTHYNYCNCKHCTTSAHAIYYV